MIRCAFLRGWPVGLRLGLSRLVRLAFVRDLALWRLMAAPDSDTSQLASLLRELGQLSPADRAAFLAPIPALAKHSDPVLRAAAVEALGGCDGIVGLRTIVGALDDDDAGVRQAAVGALRSSAKGAPARFSHAMLHPRADVRRAALRLPPVAGRDDVRVYLRADKSLPDELRAVVEAGPWPRHTAPLAFDLFYRGCLDPDAFLRVLTAMQESQLRGLFVDGFRRQRMALDPWVRSLVRANPGSAVPQLHGDADIFDPVLGAVFAAQPAPAVDALRTITRTVLRAKSDGLRLRMLASLFACLCAPRRGPSEALHDESLAAAAALWPDMLRSGCIDEQQRRRAAEGLLAYSEHVGRVDGKVLRRLFGLPFLRDTSGTLQLRLAVGLASLRKHSRVKVLLETFGVETIVETSVVQPRGLLALCGLPAEAGSGPFQVLNHIRALRPEHWPRCAAIALTRWSSLPSPTGRKHQVSQFELLLSPLAADQALEVAAHVVETVEGGLCRVGDKAQSRFAQLLAHAVARPQALRGATLKTMEVEPEIDTGGVRRLAQLGRAVLQRPGIDLSPLSLSILGVIGRLLSPNQFAASFRDLEEAPLRMLVALLETDSIAVPKDREFALAGALAEVRVAPELSAWVAKALEEQHRVRVPAAKRIPKRGRALTAQEVETIALARGSDLDAAVEPALEAPCQGLCGALARRGSQSPNPRVCVALLACGDDWSDVAAQFERYFVAQDWFIRAIDQLMGERWRHNPNLSLLGHAWLWRWEQHGLSLATHLLGFAGSLEDALHEVLRLPSDVLRQQIFAGIASVLAIWRRRIPKRFAEVVGEGLLDFVVEQLDTELGPSAAKIFMGIRASGMYRSRFGELLPDIRSRAADMDRVTRHELLDYIKLSGVRARTAAGRRSYETIHQDTLERIRASTDPSHLLKFCERGESKVVHEATLALVAMGPRGLACLLDLLRREVPVPAVAVIAESVTLWEDAACVDVARVLLERRDLDARVRMWTGLALLERPDMAATFDALLDDTLVAACEPIGETDSWLRTHDYERLIGVAGEAHLGTIQRALASSPHPNAFQPAVHGLCEVVLELGHAADPRDTAALKTYLEQGTQRPGWQRIESAFALEASGELSTALPLLIDGLRGHPYVPDDVAKEVFERQTPDVARLILEHVVEAALVGGKDVCSEEVVMTCVSGARWRVADLEVRNHVLRRIMDDGSNESARQGAIMLLHSAYEREVKMQRVAEVFAWGVRRGRELTGRLFSVHMTNKRQDFGHTNLDSNQIFVTPLPLLEGIRHGRDIVEGLILHEYGHHLYHSSDPEGFWKRAQREGIFPLLNLVADEHLERNIRALDPEYGDRLKRLASYAFQHTSREVELHVLCGMLLGGLFDTFVSEPPGVAFHRASVLIDRGRLLRVLGNNANPFAQFVRALRMSLGFRPLDPKNPTPDERKVAQGLALFDKQFRNHDMKGLYNVSKELQRIFGHESKLAESYGGHEAIEADGRAIDDKLIDDAILQQEVERILDPRQKGRSSASKSGKPKKLAINVIATEKFQTIENVQKLPADPSKHREAALAVRRYSDRLRGYFTELGLALVPKRARMRGRAFDRTRTMAVVIRKDPRMLVAREVEVHSDLFVAVLIDCSGSMSLGDLMPKAQRFGVMLAEASARLPGVDARFFGFTDRIIYDAGDDGRCAVTSLETSGGNNDAAALYHAAQVAATSNRRAKLIVMISDGLPTECSVAALRGLVEQLTRKGILCAQIAVRPLAEVCFPHYIVVDDSDLDASVRRFGEIITRLAGRALGRT